MSEAKIDIWFVASSSRPLPKIISEYVSLLKLCSWGQNGPAPGLTLLHRLIQDKHEKIFSSEITMPKALIFGMQHHRIDLYQVCLNKAPWAKNGPVPRFTFLHRLILDKHEKSSRLKPQCLKP